MTTFSNISIKQKIRMILLFVSSAGLIIVDIGFSTHQTLSLKNDAIQKFTTIAQIIGRDVSFAQYIQSEQDVNSCSYVEKTSDSIQRKVKIYILVTLALFLTSIIAVFFLSMVLENVIATPILKLKETVDRISTEKNYAIRATKINPDEIGVLVDGFNKMLSEIQNLEKRLAKHNEMLEKAVQDRTIQLQKRKQELEITSIKVSFLPI